jgi:hypothetical protein
MALLPSHQTPRPTFQINRPYTLTAEERTRLEAYRDVYPHLEYTTTRSEMYRLILMRHLWRNGEKD